MRFETTLRCSLLVLAAGMTLACGGNSPPPAMSSTRTTDSAPASAPASAATTSAAPAKHWSYAGDEGPEHWGDLDPTFSLCKSGTQQTPIDLPIAPASAPDTAISRPTYAPVPLVIQNNGHTIQVTNNGSSSITFEGVKYQLAQFHFHSPSEHTLGGKSFDAEMHLVHKSADGKILVIGLLFTRGAENATLAPMWSALPTEKQDAPTMIPNVSIDLAWLLPADRKFEHYVGSLTTPPCTEGVNWFVAEPPAKGGLEMSQAQIDRFRAATHGTTNRPPQPLRGRSVVEVRAQ